MAMALEAGGSLIDMEFMQFYPLALAEEGKPTVFIYPDFPATTRLVNDAGEDLIAKHFGDTEQLGKFDNWDHLSVVEQSEITAGHNIYLDFSRTSEADWDETSLTRMYLDRYVGDFRQRLVRVSPIMHYTIGGLRVDVDGRTGIPGVWACGEVAGGLHGANRHGGTALAEGIIFGRICGRQAAQRAKDHEPRRSNAPPPPARREGRQFEPSAAMATLRGLNQMALGPLRSAAGLDELGRNLGALGSAAEAFGWRNPREYAQLMTYRRAILLSQCMRASMLRRTESRGVHARSDHARSDDAWIRKQAVRLGDDGELAFEDVPV
jgi:aspartate oxidase